MMDMLEGREGLLHYQRCFLLRQALLLQNVVEELASRAVPTMMIAMNRTLLQGNTIAATPKFHTAL